MISVSVKKVKPQFSTSHWDKVWAEEHLRHLWHSQDSASSVHPRDPSMEPNHWGGPQKRSWLLNVMAHNWFKRWLRPWPTHCNWSIWKRVTQPLAEIAALIVLYVELRPRCNGSNLSPLVPAGDSMAQGPSQLCETSIMNRSTSSGWSLWNHTWLTTSFGKWADNSPQHLVFFLRQTVCWVGLKKCKVPRSSKDIIILELLIDEAAAILSIHSFPQNLILSRMHMLHKPCSDDWCQTVWYGGPSYSSVVVWCCQGLYQTISLNMNFWFKPY